MRYLKIAEALNRYPVGKTKLFELVKAGEIQSIKIGKTRAILVESADAFFDRLAVDQGALPSRAEELLEYVDGDGRIDVSRIPSDTTLADLAEVKRLVAERTAVA